VQGGSYVPSIITEVSQLDIMKQRRVSFLFLLDFGHKLILAEHKRWVESLSDNDGCTETLVFNAATVKCCPFNQLSSRQAII